MYQRIFGVIFVGISIHVTIVIILIIPFISTRAHIIDTVVLPT